VETEALPSELGRTSCEAPFPLVAPGLDDWVAPSVVAGGAGDVPAAATLTESGPFFAGVEEPSCPGFPVSRPWDAEGLAPGAVFDAGMTGDWDSVSRSTSVVVDLLGTEVLSEPPLMDDLGLDLAVVGTVDDSSKQNGSVGELLGVGELVFEVLETVDDSSEHKSSVEELVGLVEIDTMVAEDVDGATVDVDDFEYGDVVTVELLDTVEWRLDAVKLLAVVDLVVMVAVVVVMEEEQEEHEEALGVVEEILDVDDDAVVEETLEDVEILDVVDIMDEVATGDEEDEESMVKRVVDDEDSVKVSFVSQYGIAASTALTKI
jgi:hypothetical protein